MKFMHGRRSRSLEPVPYNPEIDRTFRHLLRKQNKQEPTEMNGPSRPK